MAFESVHIPSGCTVSVGADEASLESVGTLPIDAPCTINITYDVVRVQGSKNEDIRRYAKNMAAEGTFSIYEIKFDIISKMSNGLLTIDDSVQGQKKVSMGAPSVEISPGVVRFEKSQGGKTFRATIWSATNENGITLSFPGSNADLPPAIEIRMTGGLDSTRTEGEQLLEIIDEIGV